MPQPTLSETSQNFAHLRDHAACGVALSVTFEKRPNGAFATLTSHQVVREALKTLREHEYRGGYNPITGESDGSGIKYFGLSADFFNEKIQ